MKIGTEFWEGHVAAAKLESISTSEYARRHGLSVTALYYWQHKHKAKLPVHEAGGQVSKFVALQVADAVAVPRSNHCVLALPLGVQLSMPALPAPDWLAALVRAMPGAR